MRFIRDDRNVDQASGVQLEVIAAGLPRCATSSLQAAFENEFGLGPCMHMAHVAPHVDRLKMCRQAALETNKENRQAILHKLFDGYRASCDFPGNYFVEDLVEMYPNAKIILNKRKSPEAWHRSMHATLVFFTTKTYHYCTYWIPTDYWHYQLHQAGEVLNKRRWNLPPRFPIEFYHIHNKWVQDVAAQNGKDVLEFTPDQGWGPLCEFLEKPKPETGFPHLNDEAFIRKLIAFVMVRGLLAWMALFSAPVVAGYSIWWMRK